MELISREEVNRLLHNQREMQSRVNQLPTYDACYLGSPCEYQNEDIKMPYEERKTGKWIEKDGWDGDVYYDCSACGESWTTIEGTPWDNGMNYCPHCGAKMEGEKE